VLDLVRNLFTRSAPVQRSINAVDIYGDTVDLDGVQSDAAQAMRISAFFACVKVLAETTASLPIELHQRKPGERRTEVVYDHPVVDWLADTPNGKMTWLEAREAFAASLVARGNGFARIKWRNGYPVMFEPAPVDNVVISEDQTSLIYAYYPESVLPSEGIPKPDLILRNGTMMHAKALSFNGLVGLSPIATCSYAVTTAAAQSEHGYNTFAKGARFTGILTMPLASFKNETVRAKMRADWQAEVGSARKGSGTAILTEGVEYKPISMSLSDSEFLESQKFSVAEIARIFRVPLHKIGSLEASTNNNIEQQDREFYKDALLPLCIRIEAAMNKTLLTQGDRANGYFFRHDADAVLRGDLKTRMDSYQVAIGNGVYSRNEARERENLAPYEGGEEFLSPLNMGGDPNAGQDKGTGNADKGKRSEEPTPYDLAPLAPLIDDALRSFQVRETKAFDRARGKPDEGEKLDAFLLDHKRAIELRLSPIIDSASKIKGGASGDLASITSILTTNCGMRFAGKKVEFTTDDLLALL
jgi:HK97 family phage portal protein